MPRFYLHVIGLAQDSWDDEGEEFTGVEAAYLSAHQSCREMWTCLPPMGKRPENVRIDIANAVGEVLMSVPMAEVMGQTVTGTRHPLSRDSRDMLLGRAGADGRS